MKGMARLEIAVCALSALFAACGGGEKPPPQDVVPQGPVASPEPAKPVEPPAPAKAAPLRVAYSDWPGWTAFEVGIQKGWFKEAGIEVEFSWFDYLPSMEAFGAGKVDAVMMTNGDALVTGANGGKSKMILVTDYSNGNDKVIAKPGIKSLKDLKGKKVGLELTLVEHL